MDSVGATLIVGLLSAVVAFLALGAVLWQGNLAKKSNDLQAMIALRNTADRLQYSQGIDLISRMTSRDYDSFEKEFSQEQRQQVLQCIEFLNFSAHMVEAGSLKQQQVWNIYFMAYRIVGKNLWPWWFEAQSKMHMNRFSAIARMCRLVLKVSGAEIKAFDKRLHGSE